MVNVTEIKASSILVRQKAGSLSGAYDFSLNPYAGCAFRCSYCYVPKFPNGKHHFTDWGKWIEVKINAPQLIQKERTLVYGSRIFFGSATDPYQYIELQYRLSRRCLQELLRYKPKRLTIHTRSHIILEDLELIRSFGDRASIGVSITTDNEAVARQFEPGAPSIKRRLQLIAKLKEAGIKAHVSMAPLLPCNPEKLIRLVSPYTKRIWIGPMNYPEINNRPELLSKYENFFADQNYRKTIAFIQQSFAEQI